MHVPRPRAHCNSKPQPAINTHARQVNKDPELLLIIKTREELLGQLTSFVKTHHPYDEPEVVALPILGGSPSYLQWLMSSTKGAVAEGQ